MRATLLTIVWGLTCATSWTWCIGMYLPRILIDRFGWPGFLAFAIPNVIGCAAFGYVLKRGSVSQSLVHAHAPMMRAFSIITVAFHVYFVLALPALGALPFGPGSMTARLLAVGTLLAGCAMAFISLRALAGAAVLVYGLSLTVFLDVGIAPVSTFEWRGSLESSNLIFLTPLLCIAFALCPYCDLTFHRALQRSPTRHAFGVFGVAFALMLMLTCVIWGLPRLGWSIALAHLYAQSAITIALHIREWKETHEHQARWEPLLVIIALPLAVGAAILAIWNSIPEAVYLRFLVFYGLIFPAYVLAFMTPNGAPRTRRNVAIVFLAVLALMPIYEIGFIQERVWVLAAPVIAALAWLLYARTKGARGLRAPKR